MIRIPSIDQIRKADEYTIANEPIASIDLMERASARFVRKLKSVYPEKPKGIHFVCGPGNNGGDGLAAARMFINSNYPGVRVSVWSGSGRFSEDFKINLARLQELSCPIEILKENEMPKLEDEGIVVDAILGSGLNKPLQGWLADLVKRVNSSTQQVVSIDVPTGFFCDQAMLQAYECVKATHTISFQRPKLAFFFPESAKYLGKWHLVDIGLDDGFIESLDSKNFFVEVSDIAPAFPARDAFSHKGTFGSGLLVAGSHDKPGAAILSARSALKTGLGLLSLHSVKSCVDLAIASLPELMIGVDQSELNIRDKYESIVRDREFDALAIGPGLGTNRASAETLSSVFSGANTRLVLDADALNLISEYRLHDQLNAHSILTPHMKEFDRLFGVHVSWWDRFKTAKNQAIRRNVVIVLKNRYTFTFSPDGSVFINSTGGPSLAKGGSGDVLTGIILALRARGLDSIRAGYIGAALHGLAAEIATRESNENSVLSSDVVEAIPLAINESISASKGPG